VKDFMGIIEMIDAQLLRQHNNTATEFFEAGQRGENERIVELLEGFDPRTAIGDLLPLLIKGENK
jgi:hypothetical protein